MMKKVIEEGTLERPNWIGLVGLSFRGYVWRVHWVKAGVKETEIQEQKRGVSEQWDWVVKDSVTLMANRWARRLDSRSPTHSSSSHPSSLQGRKEPEDFLLEIGVILEDLWSRTIQTFEGALVKLVVLVGRDSVLDEMGVQLWPEESGVLQSRQKRCV